MPFKSPAARNPEKRHQSIPETPSPPPHRTRTCIPFETTRRSYSSAHPPESRVNPRAFLRCRADPLPPLAPFAPLRMKESPFAVWRAHQPQVTMPHRANCCSGFGSNPSRCRVNATISGIYPPFPPLKSAYSRSKSNDCPIQTKVRQSFDSRLANFLHFTPTIHKSFRILLKNGKNVMTGRIEETAQ